MSFLVNSYVNENYYQRIRFIHEDTIDVEFDPNTRVFFVVLSVYYKVFRKKATLCYLKYIFIIGKKYY